VIASGEALENGRVGDVIALRNLSSGQVVKGIVIGENSVALRPNID
jgi:flagella basal body P-ring formation protein FlgA